MWRFRTGWTMFEVKVTPDMGKRFVMKVAREDLAGILKELSNRMNRGLVVFVSVAPIWEKVED